ncbi:hypothetical protein [Chitinophaga niabensis]|uniref:Uncharacterized protein n=1 Tax=Chitinophaga niabensis TaxID=536979 RepID=A0A1N6H3Q4_9BACT|nr:hypothetical protein [Chitinophaga niabensis]SIO14386.1 hypothetical protein SAMN04488055_3155 [Chitinophaga niabensis]
MEKQLEQFLQRWEQAFNELQTLSLYKNQVKTTQYSDGLRYNLKKFDGETFPSDGLMTKNKHDLDTNSLYEYGFNAEGLPCYVKYHHNYNHATWEGFYNYCDDFVEYVEFYVHTGVPSSIVRIEFRDKRKISLQNLVINGRGGSAASPQMSREEIISSIRNDESAFILTATRYEYGLKDRIEKASNIHIIPGMGKFTSYDEYGYDQNETLDTIRRFFEQGHNQLIYCKLSENMTSETLVESLSEALARSIAETLTRQVKELPVALLELSYHYGDNYIPYLVCQSAQEVATKLANGNSVFIGDYQDALDLEIESLEKLYAQLEQMMEDMGTGELGRKMLIKAARHLTRSKLFGKLQVTEDFAAYAIDWTIDGYGDGEFEKILLECGVEPTIIKLWKHTGMLL